MLFPKNYPKPEIFRVWVMFGKISLYQQTHFISWGTLNGLPLPGIFSSLSFSVNKISIIMTIIIISINMLRNTYILFNTFLVYYIKGYCSAIQTRVMKLLSSPFRRQFLMDRWLSDVRNSARESETIKSRYRW